MAIKIVVENPQNVYEERTTLNSAITSGSTTLTVTSSYGFESNDYIVIGEPKEDKTELLQIDSITNSTTIELKSGALFAHDNETVIRETRYNKIKIYRSNTQNGTYSVVATPNIDYQNQSGTTIYWDSSGDTTKWYKSSFYNSTLLEETELSNSTQGSGSIKGYTSLSLIESYLGQQFDGTTIPSDDAIMDWISEVENEIDRTTNTSFKEVTVTEYYDFNQYTSFSSPESLNYVGSGLGTRQDYQNSGLIDKITLKHSPITSITGIYINNASASSADSFSLLTEQVGAGGEYIVDYQTGTVNFLTKFPRYGKRAIQAVYTYGYSSIPKVVQKLATLLVVKNALIAKNSNSNISGIDNISIDGVSISKGSSNVGTNINQINQEIKELWNKVGVFYTQIV